LEYEEYLHLSTARLRLYEPLLIHGRDSSGQAHIVKELSIKFRVMLLRQIREIKLETATEILEVSWHARGRCRCTIEITAVVGSNHICTVVDRSYLAEWCYSRCVIPILMESVCGCGGRQRAIVDD